MSQVEQKCFGILLKLQPSADMYLTYKLGRFSTLESALFAIGCALGEHEMGGVNVVFVRQAAVHGLTRYLLVPLPIRARYCHRRIRLERKTRIILYITVTGSDVPHRPALIRE